MKSTLTFHLAFTLLLGTVALSAPQKAPVRVAAPDEIRVATDDGGHGGGYGGGSESWTIRADDTANHSQTYSAADTVGSGMADYDKIGILRPGSYQRMLEYLQWTRLLDIKTPAARPDVEEGGTTVSLVRGGKTKSLRLSGDSLAVNAAASTTSALIDSLTRDVLWRTPAEFKAGTGLALMYQIDPDLSKEEIEAAKSFPRPIYSLRDAAGKQVAVLRPNTDKERAAFLSPRPIYSYPAEYTTDESVNSFFTLAPGNYKLAFKSLESPAPASMKGFEWKFVDIFEESDGLIKPGEFRSGVIRLVKKSATP